MAARKTQRIAREQRKRPARELTLDPRAAAILDDLPRGEPSKVVSGLVIEWDEKGRLPLGYPSATQDGCADDPTSRGAR
jgi:hypothetical protein